MKATAVTEDGKPVDGVEVRLLLEQPKKCATVDANGTVIAVKSGSATIEVKGGEKSAKVAGGGGHPRRHRA